MIVNKNKTEPKRYFKERNVEKNYIYKNLIKIIARENKLKKCYQIAN